MTDIQSQC